MTKFKKIKTLCFKKGYVKFSLRAKAINRARRNELVSNGILTKQEVKSLPILSSLFFTMKKNAYKELLFGGSRVFIGK